MNYIKRDMLGISIDGSIKTKSLKNYINTLCLHHGSTLQGRLDFSKWVLKTSKLPIYISPSILLFPTASLRNYDTVLINIHQVFDVYEVKDKTRVIFKDATSIDLIVSISTIKNQIKKSVKIIDFLKKESVYTT